MNSADFLKLDSEVSLYRLVGIEMRSDGTESQLEVKTPQ